MVADNELVYDGLEFLVFPKDGNHIGNTLYRTGDEIEFLISIKNKSSITKHGKIPIVCRYGVGYGNPTHVKIFEIKPIKQNEVDGFTITVPSKIEGNVLITIPTIGTTESLTDLPDEAITARLQQASYEVIYSIHIMDRGVYYQQKERDKILIEKLDSLPKVIFDEVDRRLNATKSDILDEVEKKMKESLPNKDPIPEEITQKKPRMDAIK